MYQPDKIKESVTIPEKKEESTVTKNGIPISPVEKTNLENVTGNKTTVKETSPTVKQKITREKRINARLFSRAALDERYLEKKSSGQSSVKEK